VCVSSSQSPGRHDFGLAKASQAQQVVIARYNEARAGRFIRIVADSHSSGGHHNDASPYRRQETIQPGLGPIRLSGQHFRYLLHDSA